MEVVKTDMNSGFAASRTHAALNQLRTTLIVVAVLAVGQPVTVLKAQREPPQGYRLMIKVVDENGVAVSDARLIPRKAQLKLSPGRTTP